MPRIGRRGKGAERLPDPGLRRPSNPTMVAKVAAPAVRPPAASARRKRGSGKAGGRAARAPMPASVTMGPARVVLAARAGEAERAGGAGGAGAGEKSGVLYRLVVSDADGKPIAGGVYTIRRHVLAVGASGCFAPADGKAQIAVVALDAQGCGVDLVAVAGAGDGAAAGGRGGGEEGEVSVFEYFSFELGGVTYAIPQSGYLLVTKRRGRRVEVARTPRPGGSIHGAVVRGLVTDGGGDGYSFEL